MQNIKRRFGLCVLLLTFLVTLVGCNISNPQASMQGNLTVVDKDKAQDTQTIDAFNRLAITRETKVSDLIQFINNKRQGVSAKDMTTMLTALEKAQQQQLPILQEKYEANVVQEELQDYRGDLSMRYIDKVTKTEQKALFLETLNSGYKIETAEGFYFPVIDFGFYKQYREAVTADMAAYIDIMAVESTKTPVKDAALTIGWGEVLARSASHERYLATYGDSVKAADVKALLKRYLVFTLYGSNNTPLFAYEDKQMVPAAKQAYNSIKLQANNSAFSKVVIDFMALVKQHDYTLTKEVDNFRKKAIEEFR